MIPEGAIVPATLAVIIVLGIAKLVTSIARMLRGEE